MANITLFAQAIGILPKENVKKIVRKVGTDKYCKGYNTWDPHKWLNEPFTPPPNDLISE